VLLRYHFNVTKSTYVHTYVTWFDKSWLPHTNGKADFSPPLDFYINELTIHVCIIVNYSLVCFSWSLFFRPVWCVWVVWWSSNGSGVTGKAPTQLKIAAWLARKLGHQIGYYLWYLELEWASGEAFWQYQLLHRENSPLPWLPTTPDLHPYMIICDSGIKTI